MVERDVASTLFSFLTRLRHQSVPHRCLSFLGKVCPFLFQNRDRREQRRVQVEDDKWDIKMLSLCRGFLFSFFSFSSSSTSLSSFFFFFWPNWCFFLTAVLGTFSPPNTIITEFQVSIWAWTSRLWWVTHSESRNYAIPPMKKHVLLSPLLGNEEFKQQPQGNIN